MQADFLDAHERHLQDASSLFEAERWANTDHLYGLAAECGLKRLMIAFGMPYDSVKARPSQRPDRVHANDIWDRFETYRGGHLQGIGYALAPTNPFTDWDVAQRYAHHSNFNRKRAEAHQSGALQVHELIKKGIREGLIC